MSDKIAALGREEILRPLKSLGIEVYPSSHLEESLSTIDDLAKRGCKLILVTEDIIAEEKTVMELNQSLPLTVLVLPEFKERRGIAQRIVKKIIRETLGRDIEAENK